MTPDADRSWIILANAACNGALTPEGRRRLQALLREDAAARRRFVAYMDMHAAIAWELRADDAVPAFATASPPQTTQQEDTAALLREILEQEQAAAEQRAQQERERLMREAQEAAERRPWLQPPANGDALKPVRHIVIPRWAAVAAAAALILAVTLLWPRTDLRNASAPPPPPVANALSAFTLHETMGAQWAARTPPRGIFDGEEHRLGVRQFTLEQGYVALQSRQGARILIEAPATFRVTTGEKLDLLAGKLTVDCPPSAVGFRIDTPYGLIEDLGTAFGMEVGDQGVDAHTFTGRIALRGSRGEQVLAQDQAARIEPSGHITRRPFAAAGYFARDLDEAGHRLRGFRVVHDFTGNHHLLYRDTSGPPTAPGTYTVGDGVLTITPGRDNVATVFLEMPQPMLEVGTIWAVDTQFNGGYTGERAAYLVISDRDHTPGRARTAFGHPEAIGFRLRRVQSAAADGALRVELDGAIDRTGGVPDPGGKLTLIAHRVTNDRFTFYVGVPGSGELLDLGERRHPELASHPTLHLAVEAYSQRGGTAATFTEPRQLYRLDAWRNHVAAPTGTPEHKENAGREQRATDDNN